MVKLDYPRLQREIFRDLPERTQEVLKRRFGLENQAKETLEAIGKNLNVTRERVRQIENAGLNKLREKDLNKIQPVIDSFSHYLEKEGGLKREDLFLKEIETEERRPYVFFFLVLIPSFYRARENQLFYPFWTLQPEKVSEVEKTLSFLNKQLEKINHPLPWQDILKLESKEEHFLASCLEIAKRIEANWEKNFGLVDWSEIRPRRLGDKIDLILKKEGQPRHFLEVTDLINQLNERMGSLASRPALSQTVHNELIRDQRFVLVGRGLYALKEWGYEPGTVKEVIIRILNQSKSPLTREEIVDRVLEQRMVQETTVLLNLSREEDFKKLPGGYYRLTK
jgi:hypothetical protein